MIDIQPFDPNACAELWQVYFSAVHRVCCKDYTPAQINAWAPPDFDLDIYRTKLQAIRPVIARKGDQVCGYADLQTSGLIDHFFVHADFQRQGVGRALMMHLRKQRAAGMQVHSHVSITARGFFEAQGFTVSTEQHVTVRGVTMQNYLMTSLF